MNGKINIVVPIELSQIRNIIYGLIKFCKFTPFK